VQKHQDQVSCLIAFGGVKQWLSAFFLG